MYNMRIKISQFKENLFSLYYYSIQFKKAITERKSIKCFRFQMTKKFTVCFLT